MGRLLSGLLAASLGVLAAFLLDPERGRARRARLRDRSAAMLRRGWRGAGRQGRILTSRAAGMVSAWRAGGGPVETANDATLKDRVESELLRDAGMPKGGININAEQGIVVLRGEVPDEGTRADLEKRAGHVRGVWYVENLLHLPGEPAVSRR